MESVKDILKEIAGLHTLTDEQKQIIRDLSVVWGVAFAERGGCVNCYAEQAVKIWRAICEKEQAADPSRKYLLRAGVSVRFNGEIVSPLTITDTKARKWLKAGLGTHFFSRINGKDIAY